jgi:hypothetical protein
MALKFEVKITKHGLIARLTVSVAEAQRSRLEQRVARLLAVECAERGLAVRGTISIEAQVNWLTATLDVTAAAFVVATDHIGASTARRPASSATAASRPPRVRIARRSIG